MVLAFLIHIGLSSMMNLLDKNEVLKFCKIHENMEGMIAQFTMQRTLYILNTANVWFNDISSPSKLVSVSIGLGYL